MKKHINYKENQTEGFLFQVGKFYEFYHMDADVGVKELGLLYMKVWDIWLLFIQSMVTLNIGWESLFNWLLFNYNVITGGIPGSLIDPA